MRERPRSEDRLRIRVLQRWYSALWVLLGLCPQAIAVLDDPRATMYWMFALLAVLGAGYAAASRSPRPPLRPAAYLAAAVGCLGGVAYLLGGGASLFVATLPQFWIFGGGPRRAIAWTGAAAAVTLTAGAAGAGAAITGNGVATLLGCAAGALLGLLLYRVIRHSDERARRLGAELEAARRELAEAHRLQGATEERERLAREIHDTLAQGFASIIVLAEAAGAGLGDAPGPVRRQLQSIEHTARENFAEARVLVGSAPQSGLAPGSIATTLSRTLDRFAEDTGLAVTAELPDVDCDQQTRIALLRCTQESLANVRKHSAASTVGVVLARHPHGLELEITDDGRGFAPGAAGAAAGGMGGFGLDGMRKRLAELGGELTVTSSPGDGTRILAVLPGAEPGPVERSEAT